VWAIRLWDEDIGFEMMEAATGEEAIENFHVNKPDVVLLDKYTSRNGRNSGIGIY
jgi:CheY-like chemotaxis protein